MPKIDGKEVKVGDWVSFKSDIEQVGRIIGFTHDRYRGDGVILAPPPGGFSGEYIRNADRHEEDCKDCWL